MILKSFQLFVCLGTCTQALHCTIVIIGNSFECFAIVVVGNLPTQAQFGNYFATERDFQKAYPSEVLDDSDLPSARLLSQAYRLKSAKDWNLFHGNIDFPNSRRKTIMPTGHENSLVSRTLRTCCTTTFPPATLPTTWGYSE